jgi:hypothetical protein
VQIFLRGTGTRKDVGPAAVFLLPTPSTKPSDPRFQCAFISSAFHLTISSAHVAQLAGDQKPNRQVAVDLSCEALASAMTEIEHDPQSGQPERDGGERQEHVNHGVRTFEPALPELDLPKRSIGKGCGIFRRFPIPAPDPP